MTIAALIPTYNRRAQVLKAIDSVLAQTRPLDEIIVIDDGSTDGTTEAIRGRYGARVAVYWQENAGVSAARNRGVLGSRCDWIALLDSDDIWFPTKIERQVEALEAFGGEFGLCFTDCVFDGNPELRQSVFAENGLAEPTTPFGKLDDPVTYVLAGNYPFWTQSLMIRRSLFGEIGGFDEALIIQEDTDVIFRLSFKTRFCYASEPLVRIDRNPTREDGLCNLYSKRDHRKYRALKRVYSGWLTIPEIDGTKYESGVKEMLRKACYDSAECKLHQLKVGPAIREIVQLKKMGEGYTAIIGNLLSHKISKVCRSFRPANTTRVKNPMGPGFEQS